MKHLLILLIIITAVSACKTPEARRPVSVKSGSFIDESIERNRKLNAEQQAAIQTLIKNNPDTPYIASPNGFWYYYNTQSDTDGLKPLFGDLVHFNYDVKDLNGTTIYTEADLGTQNYAMDQEELFSGLREGLKLMQAGETVTFIFPSHKGYGYYGDEKNIGTNVPLICKVTIQTITKKESN